MEIRKVTAWLAACLAAGAFPAWAADCEGLAKFSTASATIQTATLVPVGSFTPPGSPELKNLPEFCRVVGAGFLVRGLRAIADFETELQLAHNNDQLAPEVDTVFFMTSLEHSYISSSLVKEIATFGGDVSAMVPAPAAAALRDALPRR